VTARRLAEQGIEMIWQLAEMDARRLCGGNSESKGSISTNSRMALTTSCSHRGRGKSISQETTSTWMSRTKVRFDGRLPLSLTGSARGLRQEHLVSKTSRDKGQTGGFHDDANRERSVSEPGRQLTTRFFRRQWTLFQSVPFKGRSQDCWRNGVRTRPPIGTDEPFP